MLLNEIKGIKSSDRELKQFGLTIGVVTLILGGLLLWRGKPGYYYWWIVSAVLFVPALICPRLLKPVQKAWMTIALLIGWVMTRVLLGVVFYLVMTPISVVARLSGKRFLSAKESQEAGSYWVKRQAVQRTKEDYEKQY